MLLPKSLGLFVRQLGARPYLPSDVVSLEPYTENLKYTTQANEQFGLSGVYNSDSILNITLAQRDQGLSFATILSIDLGLYRVHPNSRTDELIKQFSLDVSLMFDNRFELTHRLQDPEELVVAGVLTTTLGTFNAWSVVEVDSLQTNYFDSVLRYIYNKPETGQDRWLPVKSKTVILDSEAVAPNRIELDFTTQHHPITDANGTLTYQGGGNRYLITKDGDVVEQVLDQAPWDVNALMFVEPKTVQLYDDFGFHNNKWSYDKTGFVVAQGFQSLALFPQHRMLVYVVQAPAVDNTTWEFRLNSVAWVGETTTVSCFLETNLTDTSTVKCELGIRVLNNDGTTRIEVFEQITDPSTFNIKSLTLPFNQQQPTGRVTMFLRLKHLYPGDRVSLGIAMPQIEYGGAASSRSYGEREQDLLTFVPNNVDYTRAFGMFRVKLFPAYSGIPTTAGEQYFFDTRSGSGLNGWYLVHRHDGVLEFGCVGLTKATEHYVTSASVIQMPQAEVEITCWYGEFGFRLDVNGNRSGSTSQLPSETPDMISVVRIGRDYTELKSITGEILKFSYSPTTDNDTN